MTPEMGQEIALVRIKLRTAEGISGVLVLSGGGKRCKIHDETIGVLNRNYSLVFISTRQVNTIAIRKIGRSWQVKQTRTIEFEPTIGHRNINHDA